MIKRENKDFAKKLAETLSAELPNIVQSAMVLNVEAEAKNIVYLGHPEHLNRITGRLQESITTETAVDEGLIVSSVGTNVVYAPVHEFGGDSMVDGKIIHVPARPFLTPAFEATKGEVEADVRKAVTELIRGCAL